MFSATIIHPKKPVVKTECGQSVKKIREKEGKRNALHFDDNTVILARVAGSAAAGRKCGPLGWAPRTAPEGK